MITNVYHKKRASTPMGSEWMLQNTNLGRLFVPRIARQHKPEASFWTRYEVLNVRSPKRPCRGRHGCDRTTHSPASHSVPVTSADA
jgi:hypothetical protein